MFHSGRIRSTISRPSLTLLMSKILQQLHLILGSRKLPVVSVLLHHLNVLPQQSSPTAIVPAVRYPLPPSSAINQFVRNKPSNMVEKI
jgi:hypothetical protein